MERHCQVFLLGQFKKNKLSPFLDYLSIGAMSFPKSFSISFSLDYRIYGLPWWLGGKESACEVGAARDMGWIPGLGRSPGGGPGDPLQFCCLENPHGQRSLVGYTVHGITKSQTQLKQLSMCAHVGSIPLYNET